MASINDRLDKMDEKLKTMESEHESKYMQIINMLLWFYCETVSGKETCTYAFVGMD